MDSGYSDAVENSRPQQPLPARLANSAAASRVDFGEVVSEVLNSEETKAVADLLEGVRRLDELPSGPQRIAAGRKLTLFFDNGAAYIHLKEKRAKKMGAGVEKMVWQALRVDLKSGEARRVAHIKYKSDPGDDRENRLLAEAKSPHVIEPNYCTIRYAKRGKSRVVGYAPLYGMDLGKAFSHFRGDVTTRRHLLLDAATGLRDLHSKGITHRDVKRDNVLTDGLLHARVADLGRAAKIDEESDLHGNVYYLPPEVCTGANYSPKGDVWAFGKMMYELAAGRPLPFQTSVISGEGDSKDDYRARLAAATQIDVYRGLFVGVTVDAGLVPIIIDCLKMNPDERPTMEQVVERIAAVSHPCK